MLGGAASPAAVVLRLRLSSFSPKPSLSYELDERCTGPRPSAADSEVKELELAGACVVLPRDCSGGKRLRIEEMEP